MQIKTIQLKIYSEIESIIGCKWSLLVFTAMASGKKRPGEIRKSIPGLSEKVLNERLKKLVRFEMAQRKIFPEIPPRVEYTLAKKGKKILNILRSINRLAG